MRRKDAVHNASNLEVFSSFNGLRKNVEPLRFMGFSETDLPIATLDHRSVDVTIRTSGIATWYNSGLSEIKAGWYVYWDFPIVARVNGQLVPGFKIGGLSSTKFYPSVVGLPYRDGMHLATNIISDAIDEFLEHGHDATGADDNNADTFADIRTRLKEKYNYFNESDSNPIGSLIDAITHMIATSVEVDLDTEAASMDLQEAAKMNGIMAIGLNGVAGTATTMPTHADIGNMGTAKERQAAALGMIKTVMSLARDVGALFDSRFIGVAQADAHAGETLTVLMGGRA
jgi:hypothetical protein